MRSPSASTLISWLMYLAKHLGKSEMGYTAMEEPATAPWGLNISDADFQKLKAGFKSQDMDDKWNFVVAGPDESTGNISIHLRRSWTGIELYVLHVEPRDGGRSPSARIECISWEQNKGGIRMSEVQAKKEAVVLCRYILGCDFETLPDYDSSIFWTHPGCDTDADATNIPTGPFLRAAL